jgi:hypothetical protein
MTYFQYIRVRPSVIPQEVWDDQRYNPPIAAGSYVYLEIRRGMYGLKEASVKSRAAVHFHQGWHNSNRMNGTVDVICQTIKIVVSSAAEAETGAIHKGGKHACPIHAALEELGHKQPSTGSPFETENSTAKGILTSKMRQKLSKSFDMRYWWMKDRIKQGRFNLIWAPGKLNLVDYFTKHHPHWHHQKTRNKYLQKCKVHSASYHSTSCATSA